MEMKLSKNEILLRAIEIQEKGKKEFDTIRADLEGTRTELHAVKTDLDSTRAELDAARMNKVGAYHSQGSSKLKK